MRHFLVNILLFIILGTNPATAQCPIVKVSESDIYDVKKLSLALTKNTSDEYKKACLIFGWIRQNIRYDSEAYRRNTKRVNATTKDVLRRREAVCLGYAQLFAEMCQHAGLEAVVVDGHSKQGAFPPDMEEADHAWNAVRIEGKWQLLDVTWAAESRGDQYFCTPPEAFIKEHLPVDPMWQLLNNPVSATHFKRGYLPSQSTESPFSFNDSIAVFLLLNVAERKIKSAQNAFLFNPTDSNKELLGHAHVDYALSFGSLAEKLQQTGKPDSLSTIQNRMIKHFRLADRYTPLLDWQRDNFANVLINQAVNISRELQNTPSLSEANFILEEMRKLLLEAKKLLQREEFHNFPSESLSICEEYLKWIDSYWD